MTIAFGVVKKRNGIDLEQQFVVVITAIFVSVGAADISEAGLVTITLVFTAVGLLTQRITILITVTGFPIAAAPS